MAKFYVQLGHNGRLVTEELLENKHASGVILSPVNYAYADLKEHAETYAKLGGEVLCEPQLYQTHAYRKHQASYPYFQGISTIDFASETQRKALLTKVIAVQKDLGVDAYMAPALWQPTYTAKWIESVATMATEFRDLVRATDKSRPVYAALPLHGEAVVDPEIREHVLNVMTGLDVEGHYLCLNVPEDHEALWTDFGSVYGGLAVTHALKENDFRVLLCHTNQAAFMFLGAGADAFSSGHYFNLRTFTPSRFEDPDPDSFGSQKPRYYAPRLLNSFRVIPELEQLFARRLLGTVATNSPYAAPLFHGQNPGKVVWSLKPSWLHYLYTMNELAASYDTKDASHRTDYTDALIAEAQLTHDALAKKGVQMKDMGDGSYLDSWATSWNAYKSDILGA
jgi:hypothetical protein